jgi:hypothetical protein
MSSVDLGYTVVTQYPTTEFLGGTNTQDVTAVGILTNGHGVYIEFRIPDSQYTAALGKDYAIGYTGTVEQEFLLPGVVGVSWSQEPNAQDQLVDMIEVTVQSDSGNSQAVVSFPLSQIGLAATNTLIANKVAALNGLEASGTPLGPIIAPPGGG